MITKEQLRLIGDKLPDGAITIISNEAKYSFGYVSQYFNGKVEPNASNEIILRTAMKFNRNHDQLKNEALNEFGI